MLSNIFLGKPGIYLVLAIVMALGALLVFKTGNPIVATAVGLLTLLGAVYILRDTPWSGMLRVVLIAAIALIAVGALFARWKGRG